MAKQSHTGTRLLMALGIGLVVFILAILVAWRNFRVYYLCKPGQWHTYRMILPVVEDAVAAYKEQHDSLPDSLQQFSFSGENHLLCDEQGIPVDGWQRPLLYEVKGDSYVITSLGRDGEVGGVGLDCDLTNLNPYPRAARLPLGQFLFDVPRQNILGACLASGVLAFIVSWIVVRPQILSSKDRRSLLIRIVLTIVATLIAAYCMAFFHLPSGH